MSVEAALVQTPRRLHLTVHGKPIPQGSKTKMRHSVVDDNTKVLKPWRRLITTQAIDQFTFDDTITTPVRIWIRFTFNRPPSHYRSGRNAHLLRPAAPRYPGRPLGDLDKLVRAVCDSLTDARVWDDDTQVVDIRARKFWAGEHEHALQAAGMQVVIEPLTLEGVLL